MYLLLKKQSKQPLSEISAVPTPGVGFPNPFPADGDVVLGVLGEDGPHLEVGAQDGDVSAEGREVDGPACGLAEAASSLEQRFIERVVAAFANMVLHRAEGPGHMLRRRD
jgi:hypothetical protein